MVNTLSILFKLENLIWNDWNEDQTRPYQIRKQNQAYFLVSWSVLKKKKDLLFLSYFRLYLATRKPYSISKI